MEKEKVFLVGTHRYSYQAGEPAEIIGVEMVENNNHPRPCFKLRFKNGKEDYTPIFNEPSRTEKNPHYELVTEKEVSAGHIPEVVH